MIVLSYFNNTAPESLINHSHYARLHGYRHEVVDADEMPKSLPLRLQHRYQMLLHVLRQAEPDAIVLFLSEDAAIVTPLPLERLMANRDLLLVRSASHALPQVDVQFWRNTSANRNTVLRMAGQCRLSSRLALVESEAALFAGLETVDHMELIDGVLAVLPTAANYDPAWRRIPTFAVSIDDMLNNPAQKGVSPRFRNVLVAHINRCRTAGLPLFSFPQYTPAESESTKRSSYNPGQPIALVTLYTPEISDYGRIAERNLRRYCEARGYSLHVYRDIPPELAMKASGNWLKPWLLHAYLQHHEWVVWLDADILIADQQRRLEPLLEGRDLLLAHDVGEWDFNAGVMAFRRTPENQAVLQYLMEEIAALHDKSSVYAGNGDQFYFISALRQAGLLDGDVVTDLVSLNTPWFFRRPDSFIVHYLGMWPDMRTLMMSHDDGLMA